MSFMTPEESERRLQDPRNVLSRVDREVPLEPVAVPAPVVPVFEAPNESLSGLDDVSSGNGPGVRREQDSPLSPTDLLQLDKIIESGGFSRAGRKKNIPNRSLEENASLGLSRLLLGGTATEQMFGVSQPVLSHLTQGYTGPIEKKKGNRKDDLLDEIYSQGQEVSKRAFSKLIRSLDLVTEDKLGEIKDVGKLVSVAKSLSGIIKDVTPKDGNLNDGGVHFHIYRPEQNDESTYDVIEVGANGSTIS